MSKDITPLETYQRYFLAFMAMGFFFGGCSLYVSEYFVIPFFANVFLCGWLLHRPACPKCHTSLAPARGVSLRAVLASYRATTCRQCGATLSK
jgi:hypothetical protein